MTRPEVTGVRDLTLSQWIRDNLPDSSTGFCVSDIDWVFWNFKTKRLMIVEVKTKGKVTRRWQDGMWKLLDKWLKIGIQKDSKWTYHGFHTITFEDTWFDNGLLWFDNYILSETDLKNLLSLTF